VPADYSGEELWQGLVKTNENFEMTLNGHFGGDGAGYLASTDNAGQIAHQMFLNSQFETFGGDGWLRVIEFLQDGKTVRVRTYSPFHDLYRTISDFAFEFQISPLPSVLGDYNGNHVVDAADYALWRKALGTRTNLAADGSNDGIINQLDYTFWRQRFGNPLTAGDGASSAEVPEPTAGLLLVIAAYIFSAFFQRRYSGLRF
jgi:hypothetical protein